MNLICWPNFTVVVLHNTIVKIQTITPTGKAQSCMMMEFAVLFTLTTCVFIPSLSSYEYLSKHGNSAAAHLWLQAPEWPI